MNKCWFLATVAATLACGPDDIHYDDLPDDITTYCELVAECELVGDEPRDDFIAQCENSLQDDGDVALDEGADCANGFAAMLHCIRDLSCTENSAWGRDRLDAVEKPEVPCGRTTIRFLKSCDAAWFSTNEGP